MKNILSIVFGLLINTIYGNVYFVSNDGNDTNNGTSLNSPWKTIDRVNQFLSVNIPLPGDEVLFKRGGHFYGTILCRASGTSLNPIIIGDYGTGAKPIIDGGINVNNFEQYQNNIWRAYVGSNVKQVYNNNSLMVKARSPNVGFYHNSNQYSNTSLYSNELTQTNGYWDNSQIVVRSSFFSIEKTRVIDFNNGILTFDQPIYGYLGTDNWGFYLENKLELLDTLNECYYDDQSGYLYVYSLDMPNNIVASSLTRGIEIAYYCSYVTVKNIIIQHQTEVSIYTSLSNHIIIDGCIINNTYQGISSYCSYNKYINNIISNTLASGCILLDSNTIFENNSLTYIADIFGEGESYLGYVGISMSGNNNVIRNNKIDRTGYISLAVSGTQIVEKNIIKNGLSVLNDGGAIAFDNSNGLIIQDNIIENLIGTLDGVTTNSYFYYTVGVGIYFGNISNKNVTIQRNTITNVPTGILVDHTMVSNNIQVKNNTIFNCDKGIGISDFSNYNGPNATPPYYVANFNDVYSGNIIYSLNKNQKALTLTNCYSNQPVDFGEYSNNRYFNPYNEINIYEFNTFNGQPRYWTLERWRQDRNEDLGSTRSLLRLNEFNTINEISNELINNGNFNTDIAGWTYFPPNALLSYDNSFLSNGCLKAYLPDNSIYDNLYIRNPNWFPLTNNADDWYRLDFSTQSNLEGNLSIQIKGESQSNNPYSLYEQLVPFGPEVRDLSIYFQSNNAEQAQLMLVNNYMLPTYYIDNISLHKVETQSLNPLEKQIILINENNENQIFSLNGCWSDVDGNIYSGDIEIVPFHSKILIKENDSLCTNTSIMDIKENNIIYPNPINVGGKITFYNQVQGDLSIYSIEGKLIYNNYINGDNFIIPKFIHPGFYSLFITNNLHPINTTFILLP